MDDKGQDSGTGDAGGPFVPAGVAFPQSSWTSFDRYDRYGAISRIVRGALGEGCHRILDVGDTAGYLPLFDPDLWVAGLDLNLAAERLPASVPVVGDGTRLPFPDASFDAVVSSDVLEHVPPVGRPHFLAELARVSRGLVVVAAPFNTPGVVGAEEFVRRYALLTLGEAQPQLEEHRDNGLPDVEATTDALGGDGWQVTSMGNGNLWDWVSSMLLRFQLEARPALGPLSQGYDELHNLAFASQQPQPPYYRHLVIASKGPLPDGVAHVARSADGAPDAGIDLTALASVLISANTSEVIRQDVHEIIGHQVLPPLRETQADVVGLRAELTDLNARFSVEIDHLHRRSDETWRRLEVLFPVRTAAVRVLRRIRSEVVARRDRSRGGDPR